MSLVGGYSSLAPETRVSGEGIRSMRVSARAQSWACLGLPAWDVAWRLSQGPNLSLPRLGGFQHRLQVRG